ncbi:MAG: glyoxalase superfamily protein [Verrucomicrobiales bacterium]
MNPPDSRPPNQFSIGSSIPVLRMLDEAAAKAFYLDYLGYQIDWEHRFNPDIEGSPLYMQIRLGESVLHLDGHAGADSPVAEVRVPVVGLDAYHQGLCDRPGGIETPDVADPRYEGKGTDLNLTDPSGNRLVFWRRES